ncbi:hypothetical protein CAPTEDRAFT_209746 [Capitella teleta]|uniref:Uncharacterized protein n=1 Tax=Capitella teleta TaxID=283909 RepID=R7TZ68_CAPTE|nr:hypothetical protein CAPTEDRAFT_209746 [Capitella teleta]|eukprot:ELT96235.1 hypothetical protein CAPTEDRAFT_209746 [Capitella teleta]
MAVLSHFPLIEMTKFSGDAIDFNNFIGVSQTRIVAHTQTDSDRLFHLHQALGGDPKELISGCLYIHDAGGFQEAPSLLQEHYMIIAKHPLYMQNEWRDILSKTRGEERSNAIDVVPVVQESSATVQLASKTDDHVMHSILPMKSRSRIRCLLEANQKFRTMRSEREQMSNHLSRISLPSVIGQSSATPLLAFE